MVKDTKLGTLYIVATPIGNLDDVSKRALETLSKVDFCIVEDTRKSKILLNRYEIKTKLVSYHKFSEHKKLNFVINKLKNGKNIALISDSGTPLISDPGYLLVKSALEESIKVVPIPGPSSIVSALSVSGLPLDRFSFYGFPPRQTKKKREFINSIVNENKTSVIFESGKRIKLFLEKLEKINSKMEMFVAREMTKIHETFYKGSVQEILKEISLNNNSLKGEFVIVIKGKSRSKKNLNFLNEEQQRILEILLENLERKDALFIASEIFGTSRNIVYKSLLKEK